MKTLPTLLSTLLLFGAQPARAAGGGQTVCGRFQVETPGGWTLRIDKETVAIADVMLKNAEGSKTVRIVAMTSPEAGLARFRSNMDASCVKAGQPLSAGTIAKVGGFDFLMQRGERVVAYTGWVGGRLYGIRAVSGISDPAGDLEIRGVIESFAPGVGTDPEP